MADYQIDINTLTEDIELPVNPRYTGLYFKGAQSLADVITSMEGSDTGNNLTINLTDGHKIILTDYFAKNGKYSVKTIKTDSTTENPLTDLIAYVNDNSIKGSAQNIYDTGIIKTLTTTVFDDIVQIDSDANLTINTVNGNDTIYADGGNDTLSGGEGRNTIIYEYYKDTSLTGQNTYGNDTIKLTKGETLFINVKYDDESEVDLHLAQGTGRNINDLIITNDAPDQTDKIIVQNYYAKDTGATVYINGVDVVNMTDSHPLIDQYKSYISLITGANTFNDDTTITTYKGSAISDRMDATDMTARTDKKGNVIEGRGLKIQTGFGNDRIKATNFNDEIITEDGDDHIWGTSGNDTITAGKGSNLISYSSSDFGTDTIKLTKGENLTIAGLDFTDIEEKDRYTALNNKDLLVHSKKGDIIITDYYAKDLGATVTIDGINLAETAKIWVDETNMTTTGMIKTSVLADKIDVSAMTNPFKEVKGVKYGANITSGDGNDVITGSDFNDTINAGDGNDTIIGSDGEDKIVGGKGTTKVDYTDIDSIGDDTITLTKGETLEIAGLSFGTIDESARYTSPNKKDLVITSDHGTVTIKDYYARDLGATVTVGGVNPAETAKIYFDENALNKTGALTTSVLADNIDISGLTTPTKEVKGVKFGANITSGAGNDVITGSNFNDTINAGDGNDTIIGSNGADKITGGAGQNKIVYQNGTQMDGDTITLTKGEQILIDASAIEGAPTYQVNKNNLEIKIGDSTLTLVNFASKDITYNGTNKTEDTSRVELKINGVVTPVDLKTELLTELNVNKNYTGTWLADNISASDYEDAKNRGLTLDGKGGNDSITGSKYADILKGGDGNDTITGGLENDKLYGEAGKNTFVFNTGDGKDTIFAGKGEDTIKLSCTSLSVVQNNKDLIINYSANDSVTIKDYYTKKGNVFTENPNNSVKFVEIGGIKFDIETLKGYSDANKNIKVSPSMINGTTGDDVIIGTGKASGNTYQYIYSDNGGNDIVYCSNEQYSSVVLGDGNDTVYGGNYQTNIYGTLDVGNGDNTIYFGQSHMYTKLGEGSDTVYLKGFQDLWLTGNNSTGGITHGGHDTVYYSENADGYMRFHKTLYDDMVFTRADGSDDLVIIYGENDSATLKDFYKAGNENFGKMEMYALKQPGSTQLISYKINDAIEDKGGVKRITETGTDGNDYIIGTDGNDTINAGLGNDRINPKDGNDEINLGGGNDVLEAGNGNKIITAVSGDNIINLGSGNNEVYLGTGYDEVYSGSGSNTIEFSADDEDEDYYQYNNGSDTLVFKGDSLSDLTVDRRDGIYIIRNNNNSVIVDNLTSLTTGVTVKDKDDNTSNLFNVNTIWGDSDATSQQTLTTGTGNDTVYSGLANDTFDVREGENTIHIQTSVSGNNNIYNYGGGNDTIILDDAEDLSNVKLYNADGSLILDYTDDFTNNTLKITNYTGNEDKITIKAGEVSSSLADLIALGTIDAIICDGENHNIDKSAMEEGTFLIGCDEADTLTGTGYSDYINGKGGNDVLNGGAGDDIYEIEYDNWNNELSQKIISDTSGNDTLKINTTTSTHFYFNVELSKDGGDNVILQDNLPTFTTTGDLYINPVYADLDSYGVIIEDYFTTGKIENIYAVDNSTLNSVSENQIFNAVGQGVANWLYNNNFSSTDDAMTNGTEEQIAELKKLYRPMKPTSHYSGTSGNDIMIARGNTRQNIYGNGGNDIVYGSDNSYTSIYLGDGDDIVYGGNYQTNSYGVLEVGNGNNTIYFGQSHMYTKLGEDSDTVYLKGFQDIWFTGNNSTGGITNGGHDTVYYSANADGYMRFHKTVYDDMVFTRADGSDDLVMTYGEDNSVTFKDYYKAGNEKFGRLEMWALKQPGSSQLTGIRINNAILDKGGAGDDIYNSVSIESSTVINDNGGNDIVNITRDKDRTYIIFNVNKDGTFAEGNDKLLLTTQSYFNTWKTAGTAPSSSLTINDFDSVERINTNDGYYIDTAKLNALKSDVASWLTSANGGNGYADVTTAITSGDADLSTLIAMFNRDSNWQLA